MCVLYTIADFQKEKTGVEDDLNLLKLEFEAEQTNHNSVKVYMHACILFMPCCSS